MRKVVFRVFGLAFVGLLLATSLSACGKSDDSPGAQPSPSALPTPFKGLPEGAEPPQDVSAGVIAGDEEGKIWVVTYGSSTNPAVVHEVSAEGQKVTVHVSAEDGKIATMDFMPTTSTFTLPESVDRAKPVTFDLGDFGQLKLDSLEPGTAEWFIPGE